MVELQAGVALAAAVAVVQTRHFPLGLLTALAPLPGLIWAAPLNDGAPFGALPVLSYGFGFVASALAAQTVVDGALGISKRVAHWRPVLASLVLGAALALLWCRVTPLADAALQALADAAGAAASALLLLPLVASLLHFDEDFVADANRVREGRARLWERLARLAEPRWGACLTGIALVFLALGWFSLASRLREEWLLLPLSAGAIGVGAGLWAGWREGIAAVVVLAVVSAMAAWSAMIDGATPISIHLLAVLLTTILLAAQGRARVRACNAAGDEPAVARKRALEEAVAAVFGGLGAVAVLLPTLMASPALVPTLLGQAMAVLGGIVLAPAATTTLTALFPRRRPLGELYSRKPKVSLHKF